MEIADIHVAVLAFTALVILYSDHQGFLYFTGKKQLLSKTFVHYSHLGVWAGLIGMILTGIVLVWPAWDYYLQDPTFYIKMVFVAVLAFNGVAITKLSRTATERPFAALTKEEQRTLMLSGALSATGWVGSTIIGFFFL